MHSGAQHCKYQQNPIPDHWILILPSDQQRMKDQAHLMERMKERGVRVADLAAFRRWREAGGRVPPNRRWHVIVPRGGALCGWGGQIISFLDSRMVPKDSLHIPITQMDGRLASAEPHWLLRGKTGSVAPAQRAASVGQGERESMLDHDIRESKECGVFAVALGLLNPGSKVYVISSKTGTKFDDEIPYELTHAFCRVPGHGDFDVRGQRSPDAMAADFGVEPGDYDIKGPFRPEEFYDRFIGNHPSLPLYGTKREVRSMMKEIRQSGRFPVASPAPKKSSEDTQVWYHGSPHHFDQFRSAWKAGVTEEVAEQPVFLTPDRGFARLHAGAHGWVYTVRANVSNIFDGDLLLDYSQRYYLDPETYTPLGKKVYEAIVAGKIWPDGDNDPDGYMKALAQRNWDATQSPEFVRWMKANGYDSFLEMGEGHINLGVFDPAKLEILSATPAQEVKVAAATSVAPSPTQSIADNEAFRNWFSGSKVVDTDGNPLRVYRGDYRGDKLGDTFKLNRATSGRFYFTDDPEIASSYATGKVDSRHHEENQNYENWFRFPQFKGRGQRQAPDLRQVWYRLTPEQKRRVQEVAMSTSTDDDGDLLLGAGHPVNGTSMEREARAQHGNWLMALADAWLMSGVLFDREQEFGKILEACGLEFEYDNPSDPRSLVTPVYLRITHPLDMSAIPQSVVARLHELAKNDRSRAKPYGQDQWDKSVITTREWVEKLDEDLKNHTTYAWTTIPEKVTQALQQMGYDGIKDSGGKNGGTSHTVWIAFDPHQIKSALGNKGTFDPMKDSILASKRAAHRLGDLFAIAYTETLPLSPQRFEFRHEKERSKVKSLTKAWEEGQHLPPILVAEKKNGKYLVLDGHHRVQAALNAGKTEIEAYVVSWADLKKVLDAYFDGRFPLEAWELDDYILIDEDNLEAYSKRATLRQPPVPLADPDWRIVAYRPTHREEGFYDWIPTEPMKATAKKADAPTKIKYGTVQADLPEDSEAWAAVADLREEIAEEDLDGKGRKVGPSHITVRYGIRSEDTGDIEAFLSTWYPMEATLTETVSFPPSKASDNAAVIIAPVKCAPLFELNAKLAEIGDFKPADFDYKPHVTVAYVKPGTEEKYVGRTEAAGKKFTIREVTVVTPSKAKKVITLNGVAPAGVSKAAAIGEIDVSDVSDALDTFISQIRKPRASWPTAGEEYAAFRMLRSTLESCGIGLEWKDAAPEAGTSLFNYITTGYYRDTMRRGEAHKIVLQYRNGFLEAVESRKHHSVAELKAFKRSLLKLITHERVHAEQYSRMNKDLSDRGKERDYNEAAASHQDYAYLARPREIAAYAIHAVYELREGGFPDEEILRDLRSFRDPAVRCRLGEMSAAFLKYSSMEEYVQRKRNNPGDVDPEFLRQDVFRKFVQQMVQYVEQTSKAKRVIALNGKTSDNKPKTAAEEVNWRPILTELMQVLKPGLEEPIIKIVNQPRTAWLGSCNWKFGQGQNGEPFADLTTTISLQKSIMGDEQTLRRVLAHELAHHEDNLVNQWAELEEKGLKFFQMKVKYDFTNGHGPSWKAIAARFNAKYGPDFVTPKSDQSYVVDDSVIRPFFVLLHRYINGKQMFQQASRLSPKMKELLARRAEETRTGDYPYKLIMSTDRYFLNGPAISPYGGWAVPKDGDQREKFEKLWNDGEDLLPQYLGNAAKQAHTDARSEWTPKHGGAIYRGGDQDLDALASSWGGVFYALDSATAADYGDVETYWLGPKKTIDVNSPEGRQVNARLLKDLGLAEASERYWQAANREFTHPQERYIDGLKQLGYEAVLYGKMVFVFSGEQGSLDGPKIAAPRRRYSQPPEPVDPQTQTEAFRKWFRDSKVVDLNGRPLAVYHGSPDIRFLKEHGKFQTLKERYNHPPEEDKAFWFAGDRGTAHSYAKDKPAFDYQNSEPGVFAAYLRITNPLILNGEGKRWEGKTRVSVEEAKKTGHDGIIVKNTIDDYSVRGTKMTTAYAVFDASQIKAAKGNGGGFDPENHSVYAAAGTPPPGFNISRVRVKQKKWGFDERFDACWGSRVLGSLVISPLKDREMDPNDRTVLSVEVKEPYRRLGVATKLYDAAEAWCTEHGWRLVPSGRSALTALSDDGLALWTKRRPEAVADDARLWKDQYVGREFNGTSWTGEEHHYTVESIGGRIGDKVVFICRREDGMTESLTGAKVFPVLGAPDPKYKIAKRSAQLSSDAGAALSHDRYHLETAQEAADLLARHMYSLSVDPRSAFFVVEREAPSGVHPEGIAWIAGSARTELAAKRLVNKWNREERTREERRQKENTDRLRADRIADALTAHGVKAVVTQAATGSLYIKLKDVPANGLTRRGWAVEPTIRMADHPGRHWEPCEWEYDGSDPETYADGIVTQLHTQGRIPGAQKQASEKDRQLPPEAGTAPIPPMTVRLFHYTSPEHVESIERQGLLASRGRGDDGSYSGPSAGVWASTEVPSDSALRSRPYIEFWAKPDQISHRADYPSQRWETNPETGRTERAPLTQADLDKWLDQGVHHVIMTGDVPPSQFIAIHLPWQPAARYLIENLDLLLKSDRDIFSEAGIADMRKYSPRDADAAQWVRDHVLKEGPGTKQIRIVSTETEPIPKQGGKPADTQIIDQAVQVIRRAAPEVQEIWFHGSRATGSAKRDSDWDFVAVFDSLTPDQRIDYGRAGGPFDRLTNLIPGVALDVQPASVNEKKREGSVLWWATEEGKCVWSRN